MATNLIKTEWQGLDSGELRLLLGMRIGDPGQYDSRGGNPNNTLYVPLGRSACRIKLTFSHRKIIAVDPGPAFDAAEWERISAEIENSILSGPTRFGREYSFSGFRVLGSWRGRQSGIQILPPPADAPRANVEMAEHPFILEFPISTSELWQVTNHRRIREHRKLTLLLNVLLVGRTSLEPRRAENFWAYIPVGDHGHESKWVQRFFHAKLGEAVIEELSPPAVEQLEEIQPEEYYTRIGHDGMGLRVPSDLDQSIGYYAALSAANREKFDRATFWIDMASREWNSSVSASFAALVSAIESLTERGAIHQFNCPTCGKPPQHEVPGATQRFKDFFDTYAPGASLAKRREEMYSLRSGILHGGDLMEIDQDLAFGWGPPVVERARTA